MEIELVPIDSVSIDPANARSHTDRNIDVIKGSLARFKQQKPIVVDESGVIRAGNGTYLAAKALGWDKIAIVRTGLKGAEATAFSIADNRSTDLSNWDLTALKESLTALEEDGVQIEDIGFNEDEVKTLLGYVPWEEEYKQEVQASEGEEGTEAGDSSGEEGTAEDPGASVVYSEKLVIVITDMELRAQIKEAVTALIQSKGWEGSVRIA